MMAGWLAASTHSATGGRNGSRDTARALSRLPFLPPVAEWVEAASHPAIMDTTKAREELGWRPRYTGLEALRATLRSG